MLDNFGLMEFLTVALMALLFFGPERLPQMAARIGRWLASLTRYSKAFMTQWSEETMAIQDAVAEVKGIRDEILSAQQEIAGSLAIAREDIEGAIGDARTTVNQLTPDPQALLEGTGTTPAPVGTSRSQAAEPTSASDDGIAIAKSQQVLNDLMEKRAATPAAQPATPEATPEETVPSPITAEQAAEQAAGPGGPAPERVDLSKLNQEPGAKQQTESAFDRTQRVLNKLMGKEEPVAPLPSPAEQPASVELPSSAVTEEIIAPPTGVTAETQPVASGLPQSSESTAPLTSVAVESTAVEPMDAERAAGAEQVAGAPLTQAGVTEPVKVPTESAFEKTRRVLNKLRGIEEPTEAAPVAEAPGLEPASDVGQRVTQPAAPASRTVGPAQDVGTPPSSPVSALPRAQRVEGPGFTVSYSRFEELSIQVTILQRELQALRTELQSMRAAGPQPVGEPADHGVIGSSSGESTAASSASIPVEEIG